MCDDRNQEDFSISTQVLVFTYSSGCTFHFHLQCTFKIVLRNICMNSVGTKERTGQFSKDVTISF